MESKGYGKPNDIYPWITDELEKRGIPRKHVIFEGFSMGSANSYAVTYLDHTQPEPYFAVTISNAGQLEDNFPPNRMFLEKRESKPFTGVHWIIYCGDKDAQHGCVPMSQTKQELESLGATIDEFIQDPEGDHGGFMHHSDMTDRALSAADRIIAAEAHS